MVAPIRVSEMNPIMTSPSGKTLCTYTVDLDIRYFKKDQRENDILRLFNVTDMYLITDVFALVRKITFQNPSQELIRFGINDKGYYGETTENSIEFTVPTYGSITRGQLIQTVATGLFDSQIAEAFPTFCDGKILNQYFNISRIDSLSILGLAEDSVIRMDCIMLLNEDGKPMWDTLRG